MLVCVRIPCNFRHNSSVRTPSVVICGFPHFCFDFSVIHDYICTVQKKQTNKIRFLTSNMAEYCQCYYNILNLVRIFQLYRDKTYTLSCNSRSFHIFDFTIFICNSKKIKSFILKQRWRRIEFVSPPKTRWRLQRWTVKLVTSFTSVHVKKPPSVESSHLKVSGRSSNSGRGVRCLTSPRGRETFF